MKIQYGLIVHRPQMHAKIVGETAAERRRRMIRIAIRIAIFIPTLVGIGLACAAIGAPPYLAAMLGFIAYMMFFGD